MSGYTSRSMAESEECNKPSRYGILFCITGKEFSVAERLRKKNANLSTLVPVKIRRRRQGGIIHQEKVILFPGYVFFMTKDEINPQSIIQDLDILKLLHTDAEKRSWELLGQDKAITEEFFRIHGVIDISTACFDKENQIHILDGFLKQYEDKIISVNRRAKTARICIEIAGKSIDIWIGFEEPSDSE